MDDLFKIYNATDFFIRQNSLPSILTFSESLDSILGNGKTGGLRLCALTELLGLPGTGKTQLCIQLCASVQIPNILGGLSSEALYIDTNTNFTVSRFKEILSASISRYQELLDDKSMELSEQDRLKRLHCVKALDLQSFCAFMHVLPNFIEEHPKVKLIVIDSITFPFKKGILTNQRTGLLFRLMAKLQSLAVDKQIAVVLTNEMSTRFGLSGSVSVGAFGDAWAHRCNVRVLLQAHDARGPGSPERTAELLKTYDSVDPSSITRFQITPEGIRDID